MYANKLWVYDRISIHALRGEGDYDRSSVKLLQSEFLSTPSAGRATLKVHTKSTHFFDFYPRPPRGGRLLCRAWAHHLTLFLSTPSAGRATINAALTINSKSDFYPRPPRGGRQFYFVFVSLNSVFLSTPSAGRATAKRAVLIYKVEFLSTPSAGRATHLRGGFRRCTCYFYPRPPRGGRRNPCGAGPDKAEFLSTPSAGRATVMLFVPAAGASSFLSTPSAGRATRNQEEIQART